MKIMLFILVSISILTLSGWSFNALALTGGLYGYKTMAPLSAICFLILATSFFVLQSQWLNRLTIARVLQICVLVVGLYICAQYVFAFKTDLEHVLLGDWLLKFSNIGKGRMSPVSSVLFILTSVSSLLLSTTNKHLKVYGRIGIVLSLGFSFLLSLGYLYSSPLFYSGPVLPTAGPTAVSFLVINLFLADYYRLLFVPFTLMSQSQIAGKLANAFIPIVLVVFILHKYIENAVFIFSSNPAVTSFVLLLITIALIVVAILVISKRLGVSIEKIEHEKMEIQQEKEYVLKVKNDEYHLLYEELKQSNEELNQKNEELNVIITQLKCTEEQLLYSKDKAEESDRLKTAFLQNMSHEIRTPMNAIMGFAQLLPDQVDNKVKTKYFTEVIIQRSDDLLKIINEILDISKIESGQLAVNMEEYDLQNLFKEIQSLFFERKKKHIDKNDIHFLINHCLGREPYFVIVDVIKLKQIFVNLIDNAFKFTLNGIVEFGCFYNKDKTLVFFVSDTGVGIPQDKQMFVFNRFAQIKNEKIINESGTGLGLAIVKGFIDLMKGEITVESEPNKGTRFCFSIPLQIISPKKQIHRVQPAENQFQFVGKTILIVEDDFFNMEYLKEILVKTKCTMLCSNLGNEGVQIAVSKPVDLILMDIKLPDMEGYEALNLIRKVKPNQKVIIQTAYASTEDKEKALRLGYSSIISKPIHRETLLSMIDEQLNMQMVN